MIYPQIIRQLQVGGPNFLDWYGDGPFNRVLTSLDEQYCDKSYIPPCTHEVCDGDPTEQSDTGGAHCGGVPKTNVISISYGEMEAYLLPKYQKRQCSEWMKLALQGTSVVFSSGDSGVAADPGFCLSADGTPSIYGNVFAPSFPANCPWATTVGATTLKGDSLDDGERAITGFQSGGGFSNVFHQPEYQKTAVDPYLQNHAPAYWKDTYNRTGRGYPDVSAVGFNIATILLGKLVPAEGTSASAPIFASLLNLINEERLRANKTAVGFVNPVIYKHPEMFNDITEGSNPGCGTNGFPATEG